jgi:hypothetical protein
MIRHNRLRWKWVECLVWIDRMLVALETGVAGSKWHRVKDNHRWPNTYFDQLGFWRLAGAFNEIHLPQDIANWRAVYGETAGTVRREGERRAVKGSTHSLSFAELTEGGASSFSRPCRASCVAIILGPCTIGLRQAYGQTVVISRSDRRERIFLDDVDRQDFIKKLARVVGLLA